MLVMLNGEIYNFPELRQQLAGRHTFRSQGDTEVIAHLYEDHGDEAIARLDGMFALGALGCAPAPAAAGARSRSARSRSTTSATRAGSCSGPRSRRCWPPVSRPSSRRRTWPSTSRSATCRRRARCSGASTSSRRPRCSRWTRTASRAARAYWSLRVPPAGDEARVSEDEARVRVGELLTAAVRKRLLSDVPLGALLSGGVDSSVISAIVARLMPGRLKTFTVGFEGHSFYDERAHAERVAREIGSEHHASVVKPEAASLVETLLHHHDEPFGDSSALPTYLVAREARRHVTVALNGDGGDEAFARLRPLPGGAAGRAHPATRAAGVARGRAPAARGLELPRHAAADPALHREGGAARRGAHLRLEHLLRPAGAAAPRPRRAGGPRARALVLRATRSTRATARRCSRACCT